MAIDNPLDQALAQVEAEDRATNPVIEHISSAGPFLGFISAALAALKVGDPSGAMNAFSEAASMFARDRSKYLLSVVISELQGLIEKFESLERSHQDYLNRDWLSLLLDADRRARETRALSKIERIGKIVSSAAYDKRLPGTSLKVSDSRSS